MNTAIIIICIIVICAFFGVTLILTTYIMGITRPEYLKLLEGRRPPGNIRRKIIKILENNLKGWSYATIAIVVFNTIAALGLIIWLIVANCC